MKKFLSIFLTVIMVFALAIPAFATETGPFKIGDTYFATLGEAITAAQPGETIEMTEDVTVSGITQNQFKIEKNLTIDGGGHKLTIGSAANVFPFAIAKAEATVTFTNFDLISFEGGGFDCQAGTLNLKNLSAQSKGRVCIKTTGSTTSTIVLDNAKISNTADAAASETAAILGGSGTSTITLKNGSVIQKNNPANGVVNGAAAVIYTTNNGTHVINMEAGSKIVANHASSSNKNGAVIAINESKSLTVNIADGAYLVSDTANLDLLYFICSSTANTLNLTAPDGAFLVKNGTSTTLNRHNGGVANGGKIYDYVALDTSAVEGYKSYKMVENTNIEYDFQVIISGSDPVGIAGTLKDAINAAPTGSTIKFLKDSETTDTNIAITKNLTVDLNNFTFNSKGAGYFIGSLKAGLTFKNGTAKFARGIIVQAGGHLSFENATAISSDGTGSNSRAIVKLNGAGTTKLTIKDSTLETKTTIGEPFILVEQGTDGTVDLIGKSVLKYSGVLGSNNQNHATIAVQTAANLVLNVGSESSIIAAQQSSTKAKIASVLADQTTGNITVNLAAGATVTADRTYATDNASTTEFFLTITADGTTTINNSGANFVVSADVAKEGITLPTAPYGYTIGDQEITLAEGNIYKNEAATETATIKTTFYVFTPEIINGASIRLEQPFGLRFGATLSSDVYEKILTIDPNAEFGFALAKKAKAGANFDVAEMVETAYTLQAATATKNENGTFTFMTSVYIGEGSIIPEATKTCFKEDIAAKAYVKFTVNGEEVVYWSDYNMSRNSRSLYDVAKAYYEDADLGATDNVVINHIIGVCESK